MILNEIILTLEMLPPGRHGCVRVVVENAQPRDQEFVRALATLLEVWLNGRQRLAPPAVTKRSRRAHGFSLKPVVRSEQKHGRTIE